MGPKTVAPPPPSPEEIRQKSASQREAERMLIQQLSARAAQRQGTSSLVRTGQNPGVFIP